MSIDPLLYLEILARKSKGHSHSRLAQWLKTETGRDWTVSDVTKLLADGSGLETETYLRRFARACLQELTPDTLARIHARAQGAK